jgi:hypothetical protein
MTESQTQNRATQAIVYINGSPSTISSPSQIKPGYEVEILGHNKMTCISVRPERMVYLDANETTARVLAVNPSQLHISGPETIGKIAFDENHEDCHMRNYNSRVPTHQEGLFLVNLLLGIK